MPAERCGGKRIRSSFAMPTEEVVEGDRIIQGGTEGG
jgi:hypothetical protein